MTEQAVRSRGTIEIIPLSLDGLYEIRLTASEDERGYFMRVWDPDAFRERGMNVSWVQESESYSSDRGLIRGLHFQCPPHTETKLVRVVRGAIYDVAVDLRSDSETYGRWAAVELSGELRNMFYIPPGFAHGFCTLTDNVLVAYKMDAPYEPVAAAGIRWDDPTLCIAWPTRDAAMSEQDRGWPGFDEFVSPF